MPPSSAKPRNAVATTLTALFLLLAAQSSLAAVTVSPPASSPSSSANVVFSDFLGLSVELSFVNYYLGNDSSQLPQPVVRYLSALRARGSGDRSVRLRLGGNSMDSSTFVPDQNQILELTDPNANVNDQPVDFGPQLFDVMKAASSAVGGVQYLVGK